MKSMDTKSFSQLAALLSVQPVKHAAESPWMTAGIGGAAGAGIALLPNMLAGKKRPLKQNLVSAALGGLAGAGAGAMYNTTSGGRGFTDAFENLKNPQPVKPAETPYSNGLAVNAATATGPALTTAGSYLQGGRVANGLGALSTVGTFAQLARQGQHLYRNITGTPSSTGRNIQWLTSRIDNPQEAAWDFIKGKE